MFEALTPTAVGGLLVLGPATVSIWRSRRLRPAKPMERLLALENPRDGPHPARPAKSQGLVGCIGFGLAVLALLSTPLVWDRVPWQP